ncbi:MAG: calcium/sodium antiporter [Patescibacteria group bacterium]|nr:calcium/sodium antiporter [Patescibacteria group bacterium]
MILAIFLIIVGLAVLVVGAEAMVRGASSFAKKIGVSELVIGLTIVAFGTSAPELVVNIISAFKGASDIAIGNIIGSNIFNILLILGISAVIYPLSVKGNTVWKEIPFAILAVILVFVMGNDAIIDGLPFNAITRIDGFLLISVFIIFMFYIFSSAKNGAESEEVKIYNLPVSLFYILAGLGLLAVGGKVLVDNAVLLARLAGLSESFIGLTIVAAGTSLPELATSAVAAYHHKDDIAIGNIVGSNIFNVFWILGLTSVILPLPFNAAVNADILVCLAATLLLFLFMFVGAKKKLDRWQGIVFILLFLVYMVFLVKRG